MRISISFLDRKGEKGRVEQRKRRQGEGRKEKTEHIAHIKDISIVHENFFISIM